MTTEFVAQLQLLADRTEAVLAREIDSMPSVPPRLADAMRHGLLAGGKRFRPFLVVKCAQLFGVAEATAMPAAAALECLHSYSLVHDDLPAMDNDKLRRGKPTVWAEFDDWTAILVGDALLTLAFEIISRPVSGTAPEIQSKLVSRLAVASGAVGMVGGQYLDLSSDKRGEPAQPDDAYIRRMQGMKTGALLKFACEAGGILGGADESQLAALTDYGTHIGLAFQISDDLLDVEGDPEVVGKATGKDADAGKATLVGILGIDQARAELAAAEASALAAVAEFGERAEILKQAARFVSSRKS
ncbi:MAG: polyprenyl synthetase family protein [Hyphomicrobiaceae bacterium TMED74]|nr:geranylgeranyl pyrophosphate synthase [Filomicrobium sp.]RPG35379.1 MAG: polyprenyl synthetase family protein [Hyphomicrobiaceae bacterium TMED74]